MIFFVKWEICFFRRFVDFMRFCSKVFGVVVNTRRCLVGIVIIRVFFYLFWGIGLFLGSFVFEIRVLEGV